MKLALDIATVVFMLTVATGVVLLGRIMWLFLFRPHPIPSNPWPPELHSVAMEAAVHALEHARQNFFHAVGRDKERLGFEVRRLESRITQLGLRVQDEQAPYRLLGHKRIDAWKQWKSLRDELVGAKKHEKHDAWRLVTRAEKHYRELDAELLAARQRYEARDRLLLEELLNQGVLKTEPEPRLGAPAEAHTHPGERSPAAEAPQPIAAHKPAPVESAAVPEPSKTGTGAAPSDEAGGGKPADETALAAHGAAEAQVAADARAAFSEFDLHQRDFADPAIPKNYKRYRDATFDQGPLPGSVMANVDMGGSSFMNVRFLGVHRYRACNFRQANLRNIVMARHDRPHQFAHCDFRGADFTDSQLSYMVFSRCDLAQTKWQGARLDLVKFVGCDVTGVQWQGVDLRRTVMSDDMIAACDFSGAAYPPKNYVPASQATTDAAASGGLAPHLDAAPAARPPSVPPAGAAPRMEAAPAAPSGTPPTQHATAPGAPAAMAATPRTAPAGPGPAAKGSAEA